MPRIYISSERKDQERADWAAEVAQFANDVEETIRSKRAGDVKRRETYFREREPIPFIGGTYHAG